MLAQDVSCVLLPGCSFYLAGWRKLGLSVFAVYFVSFWVYLACLGYPAANWAFMVLLSAHTASVSQRLQPWLVERRLLTQVAVGMLLFLAVSALVYFPARGWFQRHIAMPLPTTQGIVILDVRARPNSIQRGDWLGYRIQGSYNNGLQIEDGFGFGPVLALPGDRVEFEKLRYRVNQITRPRLTYMPESGELVLPQNRWLVWPEVGVRMHGVDTDVTARGMMKIAVADLDQLVGVPFKRWFFRKQF